MGNIGTKNRGGTHQNYSKTKIKDTPMLVRNTQISRDRGRMARHKSYN